MCKRLVNWNETFVTLDLGYLTSTVSSYDDIEGSFYIQIVEKNMK